MQADRQTARIAVVTGGASGIGRGIAVRFGKEGANVVVADVRREPKQGEYFETDVETPPTKWCVWGHRVMRGLSRLA